MPQKTKKTGLPEALGMRHDTHFVELISSRSRGPLIRMIPVSKIDPNPQQPRSELGKLSELMASIKSKGILEPILVRPKGDRYEIIAGERRFIASRGIGLSEVPCIEKPVDDQEAMEISLVENLQRKDLNAFEEADGLNALIHSYGYTHDQISNKIGKARSTITEIINVSKIPAKVREFCKQENIINRSQLIELSKLKSEADMLRLLEEIKRRGLKRSDTRELAKSIRKKAARQKRYVYYYEPTGGGGFKLSIQFQKSSASREEIIAILEELIARLKSD